MGRVCDWCGAFLVAVKVAERSPTALCTGCVEDLREGLAAQGLAPGRGEAADRAS